MQIELNIYDTYDIYEIYMIYVKMERNILYEEILVVYRFWFKLVV